MSIILPKTISKLASKLPAWLKSKSVVEAADSERTRIKNAGIAKTAATADKIVLSYRDSRGHVIYADDPKITSQKANGVENPLDERGIPYTIHRVSSGNKKSNISNIQSVATETRLDRREREMHPSYLPNTVVSRHIQYKALQALSDYCSSLGMYGARARYLNGAIEKLEGKHFQTHTKVDATVDFLVAPRLRKSITATIHIDPTGKFVMPEIFKTADGTELPLNKDSVAVLLTGSQYSKPSREQHRRSDTPTYKKPDPTRFNAVSK